MEETEYITKFPEVVEGAKGLTIIDIKKVEIASSLGDIELTLSDGSELTMLNTHRIVLTKKRRSL